MILNMRPLASLLITAAAIVLICSPCAAEGLLGNVEKELQYVDALVERGAEAGDMGLLQKAHRTLANLEVTAKEIDRPAALAAVQLATAFFYVRMSESVLLLSLSKTTNPGGFRIDPLRESEHFFHVALETARGSGDAKLTADTYFFVGLGYDFLRTRLQNFPGANPRDLYEKARAHMEKSAEIGTSFPGSYAIVRRIYRIPPESPENVLDENQFIELHTLLYLQASIPRVGPLVDKTEAQPLEKDENVFIDYKWRFSVKRVDTSWEFHPAVTKTSLKLLIQRAAGKPRAGSGVQITARPLGETLRGKSAEEVVKQSISLLTSAGYKVDEQKRILFKGRSAYEVRLTHEASPMEGGPGDSSLKSRQYMLIMVSSGIQYILSFNAMADEYDAIHPDLMEIVNSFTPF